MRCFLSHFLSMEKHNLKFLIKPHFQIQYLSLTQLFLLFINLATFWNKKTGSFRTFISYQKSSHVKLFFQFTFLKLLKIFWMLHCVVSMILEKPDRISLVLVAWFVCYCEFMYREFMWRELKSRRRTLLSGVDWIFWSWQLKQQNNVNWHRYCWLTPFFIVLLLLTLNLWAALLASFF